MALTPRNARPGHRNLVAWIVVILGCLADVACTGSRPVGADPAIPKADATAADDGPFPADSTVDQATATDVPDSASYDSDAVDATQPVDALPGAQDTVPSPDGADVPDAIAADADAGSGDAVATDADSGNASCDDLPVMCGGGGCFNEQGYDVVTPLLDYQGKLVDVLGQPSFLAKFNTLEAPSLWLPATLVPLTNGSVRLTASWFNYVAGSQAPIFSVDSHQCDTCQAVKASLLPSGCVTVDIDPATGQATFVALDVASRQDFLAAKTSFVTEVACAKSKGLVPSLVPLSVNLADGRVITAYPGRPSIHAMLVDGEADISALVRDVGDLSLAMPSTASVVEISEPGTATAAPVAVDVSICHATAAQVKASGCLCPAEPLPTAVPTGPSPFWFTVASDVMDVTLTADYMAAVEPSTWQGVGVKMGPWEGDIGQTCCKNCDQSAIKFMCGGWQATSETVPVILWVNIAPGHWTSLGAYIPMPSGVDPKALIAPFAVTKYKYGYVAGIYTDLPLAKLPAAKRDSGWGHIQDVFNAPDNTYTITEWGPNAVTLVVDAKSAVACRRLAGPSPDNTGAKATALCKLTSATIAVHVDVKKPGVVVP